MPDSTDPLASLSGLYQDATAGPTGVLVRLVSLPYLSGPEWRLEHSLDNGSTWSTPEPNKLGYPTPEKAIENGYPLISSIKNSKSNDEHIEVSKFFFAGKLERKQKELVDESGNRTVITVFVAQSEDGAWLEDASPAEAIRKAKQSKGSSLSRAIPPKSNL